MESKMENENRGVVPDLSFNLANEIDEKTKFVEFDALHIKGVTDSQDNLPVLNDLPIPPVDNRNRNRIIEINGKRFTSIEAFQKYMLKQNKHKRPARVSNLFSKMFNTLDIKQEDKKATHVSVDSIPVTEDISEKENVS